jgi:hypothetical protein
MLNTQRSAGICLRSNLYGDTAMSRTQSICAAVLVVLAFFFGLGMLGGLHGEDRGWAGLGLIFFIGPSMLGISFLVLIAAFISKSRAFMGWTLTAMIAIVAWLVGIIIAG